MFLMCSKDKFWPVLSERVGRPGWAADPRCNTFKARLANREALTRDLDEALLARTTAEWMEALGGLMPASPVYDVGQALDNPLVRDGGRVASFSRADGGPDVAGLVGPVRIDGRAPPTMAAPALGADAEAVLGRLGLSAMQVAALRADKAVQVG